MQSRVIVPRQIEMAGGTLRRLIAGFLVAMLMYFPAVAQEFLEGSEDIPLAPELTIVAGAGMVFDSPSGRIIESFATGRTAKDSILAFYRDTLPALGWGEDPTDTNAFLREGERLIIDFFGVDGDLSVRFTLAPS